MDTFVLKEDVVRVVVHVYVHIMLMFMLLLWFCLTARLHHLQKFGGTVVFVMWAFIFEVNQIVIYIYTLSLRFESSCFVVYRVYCVSQCSSRSN